MNRQLRIVALAAAVVLANVIGNLALSQGMKNQPAPDGGPLSYVRVLLNPWVASGVILLVCWVLLRMTLLSWADLSYVLPVTSIGYVLAAAAGKVFLGEHVSAARWTGAALIVAGASLVGLATPKTEKT